MGKILKLLSILACALFVTVLSFGQVKKKAVEVVVDQAEKATELMQRPVTKEEVRQIVNENIAEDKVTMDRLKNNWTIACFGIDSRDPDELDAGNSDVILLITFDKETGSVNMVSVYRDTCLKVGKKLNKANAAYAGGGPERAIKMLNDNLDLQIDDYVAFNWKTVATAINMLGGVDVEITKPEFKYINGYITETVQSTGIGSVQLKETGYQHLDGVQAVAYSRLRLMDDDFKRTERQRTVLTKMFEKAQKMDLASLKAFAQTVLPLAASSIEGKDIEAILHNITSINIAINGGFPSEIRMNNADGKDYVFPYTLTECVSTLHEMLYGVKDYKPSKNVAKIAEEIENYRKTAASGNSGKRRSEPERASGITETIPEPAEETAAQHADAYEQMPEAADTEEAEPKDAETMSAEEIMSFGPGYNIQETTEYVVVGPSQSFDQGPGPGVQQNAPEGAIVISPEAEDATEQPEDTAAEE